MVVVGSLVYAIGYYHRNCTGVLNKQIAKSLNVTESKLGVMSTMYFWSYALVQPFVGSLSDLYDTSYIISSSLVSNAIFTFVSGISRNFYLTCVARFFVGLGCGCMYVPVCRSFAQWFSPKLFPYAQSTIIACGGLGALLAQGPLGSSVNDSNWPNAFYIGSGISLFLSIFAFIFLKGSPDPSKYKITFKEAMHKLLNNVKKSATFRDFWLLAIWKFLTPSTYSNVSSTWGKSYLQNGLKYDQKKSSYYISITSIAWTVGAPFLALISNWIKNRKICLIVCTFIATGSTIFFSVLNYTPKDAVIIAMLFVFALSSGASLTVAAITFKEMLSKELVGTLMGCGNLFLMLGTSIEGSITSYVVSLYENTKDKTIPIIAYQYGLWMLSAISCGLSLFCLFPIKDPYYKALNEDDDKLKKQIESMETPMLQSENKV
ncbi:major facilitator superfamily transporter [Histomonas meleagridis]|uniref:major facilitator superfamily transporter n=1 Tax=Histomonas meleagridis TaxID=135588 RepID=UPI003559F5B0|nr:major facilitator superfamily transporter [Histomonas meleagridis]KAH0804692.1 major facilitator superfamily transporter [Histomonas meleagridis]